METTEVSERIARAIRYMEVHAGRPFALEEAAEAACWSLFHFHRLFAAQMGIGPGEYLRRRRLANAARDLALGRATVRMIARTCGFATAESFGRSFRREFGLSPLEYRHASEASRRMNPFLPVERPTFQRPPNLHQDPRQTDFAGARLATLGFSCPLEAQTLGARIEAFWKGPARKLRTWPEGIPGRSYGLAMPDEAHPGSRILYLAGVELPPGQVCPAWADPFEIPPGVYLHCQSVGDHRLIKEVWLYLYGYWLPRHRLEPGLALDFDVFSADEPTRMDLYLPLQIRKKWTD